MSKQKTQIINLYMTEKDKKRSKRLLEDSDDDSSDENDDVQPKAIIKHILNDDTKIISNDDSMSKIFTCEEADIHVIKNNNGEYFYKGKDIATILEYVDTNGALARH